ncbi:MAG: hypothetical protein AAF539_11700 [Planctomycetota bacterium]
MLRFGFGMASSKATASTIGVLTLGFRVHHGYLGAVMIPLGIYLCRDHFDIGWFLFVSGVALFASDIIHHFFVLWPVTGSPQFDFWYPEKPKDDTFGE